MPTELTAAPAHAPVRAGGDVGPGLLPGARHAAAGRAAVRQGRAGRQQRGRRRGRRGLRRRRRAAAALRRSHRRPDGSSGAHRRRRGHRRRAPGCSTSWRRGWCRWWSCGCSAGIGEAAFFVGAASMITDLAPEDRRGEAISYWSVAVYGGLAFGPLARQRHARRRPLRPGVDRVGRAGVRRRGHRPVHPRDRDARRADPSRATSRPPLISRPALAPGAVLFLGLIGLAGFTEFVPLYVKQIGMSELELGLPALRLPHPRRAHLRGPGARSHRPAEGRHRSPPSTAAAGLLIMAAMPDARSGSTPAPSCSRSACRSSTRPCSRSPSPG